MEMVENPYEQHPFETPLYKNGETPMEKWTKSSSTHWGPLTDPNLWSIYI